jgi:hypothetical protein
MASFRIATNNTPCEIIGFYPNIRSISQRTVDLTQDQQDQIHQSITTNIEFSKHDKSGIKAYETHIGSYELHYINRILAAPIGTVVSWVRVRSILNKETNEYNDEDSDTIFLVRTENKLWNGLINDTGVVALLHFQVVGMTPNDFNVAVAIAKTNSSFDTTEIKDACYKITQYLEGTKYGSKQQISSNCRMARMWIQIIISNVSTNHEIVTLWNNILQNVPLIY